MAAVHLAAQQMEILRRGSAVADQHVIFGAQREETFDARAGMLGPLPFEAVRQQHHQAAGLSPFLLAAGDELVDHDLRSVGEIAELRFPDHQRQRVGHAVAEFKAQHGILAQRTVEHVEAGLLGRDMLQRHVVLAGFRIVKRQVALAKGAAAGILAAEPDRGSFQRQSAKGQRFGEGPVDIAATGDQVAALLDEAAQFGMQVEVVCESRHAADHSFEHLRVDRGPRAEAADFLVRHRAQLL